MLQSFVRVAGGLNLAAGVHHGRVIPFSEEFGDFRQTLLREFLREIHRNLTGVDDRSLAGLGGHIRKLQVVVFRHGLLDVSIVTGTALTLKMSRNATLTVSIVTSTSWKLV